MQTQNHAKNGSFDADADFSAGSDAHLAKLAALPVAHRKKALSAITQKKSPSSVFGIIRNGMSRLPGRSLSHENTTGYTGVLNRNTAVYSAFFIGPAAILGVYQSLLKMAGKSTEDAFPEGTWQFYVDYALREDTARHTTETCGFDAQNMGLSQLNRMTAWVMAASFALCQYDNLLKNEWRERVYIFLLCQLAAEERTEERCFGLYRRWESQRPYSRGADANPRHDYPRYRYNKFDQFLRAEMAAMPPRVLERWVAHVRAAKATDLPAYQRQLSILAYLQPGIYGETRQPVPLREAQIGVIWRGQYYLLPVGDDNGDALSVEIMRANIAAILASEEGDSRSPAQLRGITRIKRSLWPQFGGQFNETLKEGLSRLRMAPILLNFDKRPSRLPLSKIRQAERGVGGHAITVFDTGDTFVFDLSHIFFDGAWGAALAEIITNQASAWGFYLHRMGEQTAVVPNIKPLPLPVTPADWHILEQLPRLVAEAFAESEAIDFHAIQQLRLIFKQRDDLVALTVNDILLLYRAIHAVTYRPSRALLSVLGKVVTEDPVKGVLRDTLTAIRKSAHANPAVLIPVDASRRNPRERLHPLSVSLPLEQLNLLEIRSQTMDAYRQHNPADHDFDALRKQYLALLGTIGEFLSRAKETAVSGESPSVGTIKLLAHLPTPVQRLLDRIPDNFDILNDIVKGREVFSNVGRVADSSSLTRFISAKDDNENKLLAWGVLTDANDKMRISLRDFRPHVAALTAAGYQDLANRITQDYLDAYAIGLNQFIEELLAISSFPAPHKGSDLTALQGKDYL